MPQRPRRRLPAAERREAILGAAEEAFGRLGYHGASLEEIAHAAGVSKALIYEHFDSKRELHGALLERHVGEIFSRLQANADAGTAGEERLRGGIDAFLRFVEEHRDAWRFLFRDAADPEVADRVAAVQAQAAGVIAALIEADPEGPTDPIDVQVHAQLLSGAVQSVANWWHEHQELPREQLVDRTMEFCWLGIRQLRAGEGIRRAAQNHAPG